MSRIADERAVIPVVATALPVAALDRARRTAHCRLAHRRTVYSCTTRRGAYSTKYDCSSSLLDSARNRPYRRIGYGTNSGRVPKSSLTRPPSFASTIALYHVVHVCPNNNTPPRNLPRALPIPRTPGGAPTRGRSVLAAAAGTAPALPRPPGHHDVCVMSALRYASRRWHERRGGPPPPACSRGACSESGAVPVIEVGPSLAHEGEGG